MDQELSPLEILITEFLPPAGTETTGTVTVVESEAGDLKCLRDLQTPTYGNDPNELIKHRFLYRGAVCLLCGPTGVGKSALLMQMAIHLAVGKTCFGLEPGEIYQAQGMRILLVQAENDEGDLAEMRDGVVAGCDGLSEAEKVEATCRIMVRTLADKNGDAFASELNGLLLEQGPFDLVIVDPAFAYLGGDSNSQRDVSHFMRELLNPLLQWHNVGLILAHHTNKPLRGREKEGWAGSDFAYLGAGSAEWINPARAALAIRSIGLESVFELRAAKRGRRLRWNDANGNPTNARYIGHDLRPGVICWREVDAAEVEAEAETPPAKAGRPRRYDEFECVHAVMALPGEQQSVYVEKLSQAMACAAQTVRNMLGTCVRAGWLTELGGVKNTRYQVTERGQGRVATRPAKWNWVTGEAINQETMIRN